MRICKGSSGSTYENAKHPSLERNSTNATVVHSSALASRTVAPSKPSIGAGAAEACATQDASGMAAKVSGQAAMQKSNTFSVPYRRRRAGMQSLSRIEPAPIPESARPICAGCEERLAVCNRRIEGPMREEGTY